MDTAEVALALLRRYEVHRQSIMTILLWTNNYPVLYLTEGNKRSGAPLLLHVPTYSPVL
jgi:hypothetical protein